MSYVDDSFTSTGFLDTVIQGASARPFGTLDIAAADNTNFLCGNANGALSQNQSTTVDLRLSYDMAAYTSASALEQAFRTAFFGTGSLAAVMRFQQVEGGLNVDGRDKLTASPIPLPAVGWLLLGAFAGLAGLARLRRPLPA